MMFSHLNPGMTIFTWFKVMRLACTIHAGIITEEVKVYHSTLNSYHPLVSLIPFRKEHSRSFPNNSIHSSGHFVTGDCPLIYRPYRFNSFFPFAFFLHGVWEVIVLRCPSRCCCCCCGYCSPIVFIIPVHRETVDLNGEWQSERKKESGWEKMRKKGFHSFLPSFS